jgi:hypothetical protein
MGGYWFGGLWTPSVNRFYLVSLPGVVVAIFLGRAMNRRMQNRRFVHYVYLALTVIGAVLLLKAVAGWSALTRAA